MEMRNLDNNILYRICEELTAGNHCGSVAAALLYKSFADLPAEKIAASIDTLVARGLLRAEKDLLYLTPHGLMEIQAFIPASLLPTCNPKKDCFPAS